MVQLFFHLIGLFRAFQCPYSGIFSTRVPVYAETGLSCDLQIDPAFIKK